MKKELLHKTAWIGATLLFLFIAWATSIEEPIEVRSIPVIAHPELQGIWIMSETTEPLTDLNLVLNGIFVKEGVTLGPGAELRIPFTDFKDRNQDPFPPSEKPFLLEVFQNGSDSVSQGSGGYTKIVFE